MRPVLHSSLPNFSADHRLALALRITTPAVRFDPEGLKEKGLQNLVKTVVLPEIGRGACSGAAQRFLSP